METLLAVSLGLYHNGEMKLIDVLRRLTVAPAQILGLDTGRLAKGKKADLVIFDPPRAGAKEQAAQLAKSKVKKIIAVSCNPATFARDARILQDGGYTLKSITLIDQFIWSAHVEIFAIFTR